MHHYDVALGVQKHWDSGEFTYSSKQSLSEGQLVSAPFGKKNKVGMVTRPVDKPTFAVKALTAHEGVTISEPSRVFLQWYGRYYSAKPGQVYSQFFPAYLTKKTPTLPGLKMPAVAASPSLNKQQAAAKTAIEETVKPSILHGVTGSGKTRVYLSLVTKCLAEGKSALLLYPEISLTPQLLGEMEHYAPVIVFHSNLTDAERSKAWYRIATTKEPVVIIGPRSALFLPFKDLGLILIDEAHESTFKQESDIHYNGLLVAGGLAKAHAAKLVIGSATPPITETELVLKADGNMVCMHELAIENNHQKIVAIVDRKVRRNFTKHRLISDGLLASVESSLSQSKQSLLFINRRGTAKLTMCEQCGWQADCDSCDLPLTYHHDRHKLICHTCGKTAAVQPVCPKCGHATSLKTLGSKAIVEEIRHLIPSARIGRFDADTDKKESFAASYDDIKHGSIDILIGTQQIAKGLDLPRLRTVGILDADLSLHFPDYSSDERTFQLISQVAGRVGRGHGAGEIFVQTLHPRNTTIGYATKEDWHAFRDQELLNRKQHGFPPYVFFGKVIIREKSFEKAYSRAEEVKSHIVSTRSLEVDGPIPAFHQKRGGHYYVHLHLKTRSRKLLLAAVSSLEDDVILDLDPVTLL